MIELKPCPFCGRYSGGERMKEIVLQDIVKIDLDELEFKYLLEKLSLIQYKDLSEDELMDLAEVCARVDNKANDEIYRRLCEEEVGE